MHEIEHSSILKLTLIMFYLYQVAIAAHVTNITQLCLAGTVQRLEPEEMNSSCSTMETIHFRMVIRADHCVSDSSTSHNGENAMSGCN